LAVLNIVLGGNYRDGRKKGEVIESVEEESQAEDTKQQDFLVPAGVREPLAKF
jgi:hypothetical protein